MSMVSFLLVKGEACLDWPSEDLWPIFARSVANRTQRHQERH